MTRLNHLKQIEDSEWTLHQDDTFISSLGDVLERGRDGTIQIGLQTDKRHVNLGGIVHGGVVMTLIDRAVGINCRYQAEGQRMVTASLTTNFLGAINVGDFVSVNCLFRKVGRRAMFADAEVWVGDKLVATGTGMWLKLAEPPVS